MKFKEKDSKLVCEITSHLDGAEVYLQFKNKPTIVIHKAEILFFPSTICISGYRKVYGVSLDENNYELVSYTFERR